MNPAGIDGKVEGIGIEGDIYFYPSLFKKIAETVKPIILRELEKRAEFGWYHDKKYKLDEARKNERIAGFPEKGDCVLVISLDGSAEIKLDSPTTDPFDLEIIKKIRHPFEDLYLTNAAQPGKTLKLRIGKGDFDIIKTVPDIDLSGLIRNDYLDQLTDPLKIGQIIKDGHIVPHADIDCEKILITGTTRLDKWRSTEDYTYIAPGKILLHAATKLSDWQHPSDTTYIHGGQIYTESILTAALAALSITTKKLVAGAVTAEKMTITDLADIKNLLTVAEEKILIGEDVLGANLHGIKIVDEQTPPVMRLGIGHLGVGLDKYGIDIWDKDGTKWIEESNPQSLLKKIYDNELSDPATSLAISGLNGNEDKVYLLLTKIWNTIAGDAPNPELGLRLNNDSGGNYGWQQTQGAGTTVSASQFTATSNIALTYYTAASRIGFAATWIFAKSGKIRTVVSSQMFDVSGTTVGAFRALGGVWNNAADNITEINLVANKTNGIGAGSHIVLYKIGD